MSTPPLVGVLDGYTADTRQSDPVTSHEARDGISPEALADSQQEVLAILHIYGPQVAVEIVEKHEARHEAGYARWRLSDSRLRTAVKELATAGRIECVGKVSRASRPGGRETTHQLWAVTL